MSEKILELPTEFTFGEGTDDKRVYDVLSYLKAGERKFSGEIAERAKELGAHLGAEHLMYILNNQSGINIPSDDLREKIYFVFTDSHSLFLPKYLDCACRSNNHPAVDPCGRPVDVRKFSIRGDVGIVSWNKDHWCLSMVPADCLWGGNGRLLRPHE